MDVNKRLKYRGSISIEASLIFPLVLFVLMITIYIMIYAHEMTCLKGIANRAVLEIQKHYENTNYSDRIQRALYFDEFSEDMIREQMTKVIKKDAKEQLLIKDKDNIQVEIKKQNYLIYERYELTIRKEIRGPIKSLGKWMNIVQKSSTKYFQPTQCIRDMDFIDDLTSEIEVIKPIKNKYYDILEKIEITINEWI